MVANKLRQSGNILFTLFAAVGVVGLVGVGAMNAVKGPSVVIAQVTQQSLVENQLIANGRLALTSIQHLPAGGDCDTDGVPEAPGWITAAAGVPYPAGGGLIPSDIGASRIDGWKTTYGYCVWDHGTARRAGSCPNDNRLEGAESGGGILVAIISAGPDKTFQTSCADAAGGYVVRDSNSDDIVFVQSFADAAATGGDLWKLKVGSPDTAEIDKSLEIVDSGGDVTASIDNETGIGEFQELVTNSISGKSGEFIGIDGGLQLADEVLVTDAVCTAENIGTLRYHSVNGVEVCNGTEFVPLNSGGGGGGAGFGGLYEGKISSGYEHTCGVRLDGVAYCWGRNQDGQLGDGTTTSRNAPVKVSGGHKFLSISASFNHTCGLRTDGAAYCWGNNGASRLGDGTSTQRLEPHPVSGGHKFVKLSVSPQSGCGIRTDGKILCWGNNGDGQLGDGTKSLRSTPKEVSSGSHRFVDLAIGHYHTCAIRADGVAMCWGANAEGSLGRGDTTDSTVPVEVSGEHKFTQIASGLSYSCGLRLDGVAMCWGINNHGQLGNGSTTTSLIPVEVGEDLAFVKISAENAHACGLRNDGTAMCWGLNWVNQLGDGTSTGRESPVPVIGLGKIAQISVGPESTCAIQADGMVYCWGRNNYYQLSDGTTTNRNTPVHVQNFSMLDMQNRPYKFAQDTVACSTGRIGTVQYHGSNGLMICDGANYVPAAVSTDKMFFDNAIFQSRITSGYDHVCLAREDGIAYCWGDNTKGQVGDGTSGNYKGTPTLVSNNIKFASIDGGAEHTCGLTPEGVAYCWGANEYGQLGDGTKTNKSIPTLVTGDHKFMQLEAGEMHTCGLKTNGEAWCWGWGLAVGDGLGGSATSSGRANPVKVIGGRKFVKFKVGYSVNCGIEEDGTTYCWGYNDGGVGDGTLIDRYEPRLVLGGHKFAFVRPGMNHTCGIRIDGTAMCWGAGTYGKTGLGNTTTALVPEPVAGDHKFRYIGTDLHHTCAVRVDGVAMCWGQNDMGQLGDGTTTGKTSPIAVYGGGEFVHVVTGGFHTCGLKASGMVMCWGANWTMQHGDGTNSSSSFPKPVAGISMSDMQDRSFQFANDTSTCAAHMDGTMRYVGGATKYDYCNGTAWVPFTGGSGMPWKKVAVGWEHTCALQGDGSAYCWGDNQYGALGNNTTINTNTPTPVSGGLKFVDIQGGGLYTCGLTAAGDIYCWGHNWAGQHGRGNKTQSNVPAQLTGHKFTQMSVTNNNVCALKHDGAAYCWGQNNAGQLGDNSTTQRTSPVAVSGSHIFIDISTGAEHTCALKGDGSVWCWGRNTWGQLGDNTTTNKLVPTAVSGSYKFRNILVGENSSCGIIEDGTTYCWGQDKSSSPIPVLASGSHIFTSLGVSRSTYCGIKDNGAAYCWGWNPYGQIGDGTTTYRTSPRLVDTALEFKQIRPGQHTCALSIIGEIWCWGINDKGQLGDGTNTNSFAPVQVSEP
jgi:alpha-tubulin suppressor-like RCC1 family protein